MNKPARTLTYYVEEDLRRRIQSGQDLPSPLTLARLSQHYGVSLAPVRSALDTLIEEGLICKKESNGRVEVNSKKTGAGLIEHIARRGWRVRPLSLVDVRAYLQVRETLELKAMDLAKPHLIREDLEQMLVGNRPNGDNSPIRLDNRLHGYIIEKSANHYIRDFFRQYVSAYYRTLFDYAAPEASVVAEMADQHCRILDALINRAWVRARAALVEHIQSQELVLSRLLRLVDSQEAATRSPRAKPVRSI